MNSKNQIILIVVVVLAILGIALFFGSGKSGSSNAKTQSASVLSALENDFDFGTISMKNGNVSKMFELKNGGTDSIVINKVYTSCMCTEANIIAPDGESIGPYGMPGHGGGISKADVEVKPGETVKIEAIFNPAAHGPSGVGLANRTVFLETNSSQTPKLELNFKAMVTN